MLHAGPHMSRYVFCSAVAVFLGLLMPLTMAQAATSAASPLVLESTFLLPDVRGRIDHMAFDSRRQHLIVAALGNDSVEVIDIGAGKVIQRIRDLKEPQGVAYSGKADLIFVANAGDGSVQIFRAADFAPVSKLDLHRDADNIRIDPRNGDIVVGYGVGALAIVDPLSRAEIATVKLEAHPEGFQIEPATGRAFVNVPDANQIAVVDLDKRQQVATWKTSGFGANFPMALDAAGGKVAVVFRSPAELLLFDRETGAVRARRPVCGDADDVFFDAKRQRYYVSCGKGSLDVFQAAANQLTELARIPTSSGARTSLFVPEVDRLFLAVRAGLLGSDASIQVYRPTP
jgi:DNA-binding beta-propeller fold protein YncE